MPESMGPSFRTVRWVRTFNLVLQAVLFLTFFGGLNYVAKNHAWRFDLTRQRSFSLSPETLSYIKNLQRPVHIVLTLSPESENPQVKGLIDEYFYATSDNPAGRITKETLDVYQNRRRSEELGVDQADLLVLLSGDKRRVVTINELYTMKDKQRDTFRGEQVLTDAILNVATAVRQKIYFVEGHGELRIDDPDARLGMSQLRAELRERNFDVESVNLGASGGVPADASVTVIAAPRSRFSPPEQEMLRQYLTAKAGRLIILLAPGATAADLGLEDLLLDWGVLVQHDLIIDADPAARAENGDLLVRAFSDHPITKTMHEYKLPLRMGFARTVVPDPGRALGGGLKTVTLAATSPSAWGERDFRTLTAPQYDAGIDTRPMRGMDPPDRLGVAVASERLAVRDNLPFSVRGGKLVVFGTGDLVTNSRMDVGNFALFLNAVNWAADRDSQLTIPPRPIERFQLSLSAADFSRLRYALLFALPGVSLVVGLLVYWTRRT